MMREETEVAYGASPVAGPDREARVKPETPKAPAQGRASILVTVLRGALQAALVIAFVLGSYLGARWLVATKPQFPLQATSEPSYAVATTVVSLDRYTPTIDVFGQVEARNSVELRALVAGIVASTHPNLIVGQRVASGDELVTIDDFTYQGAIVEATANLDEAEARLRESEAQLARENSDLARAIEQLELAERDLARAEALQERGTGTEQTVDNRRLTVSQRAQSRDASANAVAVQEARIAQQNAAIARLKWGVRDAQRDLRDTVLKAPFDAVVRSESVEAGQRVGVNDIVATLYQAKALDVRFNVSDGQFGRILNDESPLLGRPVDIEWLIGGTPVRVPGMIERIGSDVTSQSGGVELFATVDVSSERAVLKPGAFVSVRLSDRSFANVARVPETALYNGDTMYVVENDRLKPVAVSLVAWDGGHVLVRGELDGAEVLVSRLAEAGDGVLIRRTNIKASIDVAEEQS